MPTRSRPVAAPITSGLATIPPTRSSAARATTSSAPMPSTRSQATASASRSPEAGRPPGLLRLEHDHWDLAVGPLLVVVVVGPDLGHQLPEPLALLTFGDGDRDREPLALDLDLDV